MKLSKNLKIACLMVITLFFNLILIVNPSRAMSATVSIPEKYSEVVVGQQVYFETEIKWPENNIRQDLRMEYYIRNQNGDEIAYTKVLKAIETQATFMDFMNIPESTNPGRYKLFLKISDYKELNQDIAVSFNVLAKKEDLFGRYLIIILSVVCLIAITVLIELYLLIKKKG